MDSYWLLTCACGAFLQQNRTTHCCRCCLFAAGSSPVCSCTAVWCLPPIRFVRSARCICSHPDHASHLVDGPQKPAAVCGTAVAAVGLVAHPCHGHVQRCNHAVPCHAGQDRWVCSAAGLRLSSLQAGTAMAACLWGGGKWLHLRATHDAPAVCPLFVPHMQRRCTRCSTCWQAVWGPRFGSPNSCLQVSARQLGTAAVSMSVGLLSWLLPCMPAVKEPGATGCRAQLCEPVYTSS